ncbi:MAG: hypothetical protein U5Q44_02890 [Dehalococcoidia bacterium]|nr:hypothetical protein [Dehalococcoidia bacterium]
MAKRWKTWTVLVAVLAGLLAAVACGTDGDSDDSATNGGNGSGSEGAAPKEDAAGEPASGGDGLEETAGDRDRRGRNDSGGSTGETLAFQDGARKVIFRSQLELTSENVEATYREITSMARQVGGYVSDAQVTTSKRRGRRTSGRASPCGCHRSGARG